jgi:hypothetical protein
MALLRARDVRRSRPLPPYRYLTCAYNGHQVSWCRGLCEPIDGHGQCGRVAPHALIGRTQLAIAERRPRHGTAGG